MKIALAGDTMLGRGVAEQLARHGDRPTAVIDPRIAEITSTAELCIVNLECAISDRGTPWPDPGKPFHFRAPPSAVEVLHDLGVDCVTLANNHALDFGETALLDTIGHLHRAGIAVAGAGPDRATAQQPVILEHPELSVGVVALTDHPVEFAAGDGRAGVAFADLRNGRLGHAGAKNADWVPTAIGAAAASADAVIVSPHWGPNLATRPVGHVRRAASAFLDAGATLVAGHSAHIFHGIAEQVLFDLGDFVDDYAVDPLLRNDHGVIALVELDGARATGVEIIPIVIDHCRTRLADDDEFDWIAARLGAACHEEGTKINRTDGRLRVDFDRPGSRAAAGSSPS